VHTPQVNANVSKVVDRFVGNIRNETTDMPASGHAAGPAVKNGHAAYAEPGRFAR
jgi:hypothetical protein